MTKQTKPTPQKPATAAGLAVGNWLPPTWAELNPEINVQPTRPVPSTGPSQTGFWSKTGHWGD